MEVKSEDVINMLDQIILKFEWQDAQLKKQDNTLTGESWDLFHLKKFKGILLEYIENQKNR